MNTKKTFLIVTVDTRIKEFKQLLESIYLEEKVDDWQIVCVLQNYNEDQKEDMRSFVEWWNPTSVTDRTKLVFVDELVGPHSARIIGLKSDDSDIWCNLDDDMEIIEQVNLDPVVNYLKKNPQVGFVSGNWVRSEKMLQNKKILDKYVKQAIIYTGGGLVYRSDIAEMMKRHADKNYLFDDVEWSMTAFINGYENFRYRGSVIIHRVCTSGGRRVWVAQKDRDLPDPELIKIEKAKDLYKGVDNNYKIPGSSDLTDHAKDLHKANKRSQ